MHASHVLQPRAQHILQQTSGAIGTTHRSSLYSRSCSWYNMLQLSTWTHDVDDIPVDPDSLQVEYVLKGIKHSQAGHFHISAGHPDPFQCSSRLRLEYVLKALNAPKHKKPGQTPVNASQ